MAKKIKWDSDAELGRQMNIKSSQITQGIVIHANLHEQLKKGLLTYGKLINANAGSSVCFLSDIQDNEQLKLFCVCNRFNAKTYLLLRLAGVKKVGDLLDKENSIINRNWAKVKEFV